MSARLSLWIAAVLGLVGGFAYDRARVDHETRVVFLSVGQGDSTLFMSEGWTMVVDVAARQEGFDAGERLVAPALRRYGVRKIDCLVLTHPDLDHVGGLPSVAARFEIGQVVASAAFRNDEEMLDALGRARISPDQVTWVKGAATTKIGKFDVKIIAPSLARGGESNDGSLFMRVESGKGSIAMSGDAPSTVEDPMGEAFDFDVQILKAGHHGSRFSTSSEWLEATSPSVVIASCGRRNTYGHPHPFVIDRVRKQGADFLRTDRDGSIEFVLDDFGFARAN
jgi:competence protein ComEC